MPKLFPAELKERLHTMLRNGASTKEVVAELGLSEDQVTNFKRKNGYCQKRAHACGEIQTAILAADRSVRGWQSKVAAELGIARQLVSSTYKKMTDGKEL